MQRILLTATVVAWAILTAGAQQTSHTPPEVPAPVMKALQARFPHAVVDKCTKEKEHGAVVYDIEFTLKGMKREADVQENGTIENWEQAVTYSELPAVVHAAVDKAYPGCTVIEAMQTMVVKDGKDELEGYEVTVRKADKKRAEITVAPDGTVLEGPGARQ